LPVSFWRELLEARRQARDHASAPRRHQTAVQSPCVEF
jgi:hypothetical protein